MIFFNILLSLNLFVEGFFTGCQMHRFIHSENISSAYSLIFMHPCKTKRRFWAKFHLFSEYFRPMVPHLLFFRTHVYRICLFQSIFRLKSYPILVINSSMGPLCCFSTHMFTASAYFPPIFRSFSAYFQPIFRSFSAYFPHNL